MLRTVTVLVCLLAIAQCAMAQSIITAKTFVPPGCTNPATGDGKSDDTAALQGDIDYAIAHQIAFQLEPGTYMISKTLTISVPVGSVVCGFMMAGQSGPNRNGAVSAGGVAIALNGSASTQPAVLAVGSGAFRDMSIENIAFGSAVGGCGTPYGVAFANTGFSHATLFNDAAFNVGTAFAVLQDTDGEANGEGVELDECTCCYCNCFFLNNSGQAYTPHVVDSGGTINNGGVCFRVGNGNLGNDLDVFGTGFSMTPGPLRNTYFENDGISGTVNIEGGRVEHCDTVLHYGGGSLGDQGVITMRGIQFTAYTGNFPLVDGTLNGFSNAQYTDTFQSCKFEGVDGAWPALKIGAQNGDLSNNYFDRCVFLGFSNGVSNLSTGKMGIVLNQCRYNTSTNKTLTLVSAS